MKNRRRRSGGFTLIELLLVVVIIGILAAIVVPRLAGRSEEARISAALGDIGTFKTALGTYELDNGKYPTSGQGLLSLIALPSAAPVPPKWKGPYIQATEIPKDPWGGEYLYACPGMRNPSGFDLFSAGPDGQPGNEDDVPAPAK